MSPKDNAICISKVYDWFYGACALIKNNGGDHMYLVLQKLVDESFDSIVVDIQKSIRIESVLKEENITEKYPFGSNVTAALTSFLENAE